MKINYEWLEKFNATIIKNIVQTDSWVIDDWVISFENNSCLAPYSGRGKTQQLAWEDLMRKLEKQRDFLNQHIEYFSPVNQISDDDIPI
jgi:hypothetical protein